MAKIKYLLPFCFLWLVVACTPTSNVSTTPSVNPTATLFPTPSPQSQATDTAVPTPILNTPTAGSPTTLPANPPAPPPLWKTELNLEEWIQGSQQAATDLVNWAQGDPGLITAQMATWGAFTPTSTQNIPGVPNAWAQQTDLDSDGTPELLLAMPSLESRCQGENCQVTIFCDFTFCPAQVFIFQHNGREWGLVYQFGQSEEAAWGTLSYPQLFTQQDLNNDNIIELVISDYSCGANTCFTNLTVGQWHNGQWQALGVFGQASSQITLNDWDGDGTREFILYGGMVGSVGAGMQRPHMLVYGWQNGRYELLADTPDSSNNPYFLILDAHTALQAGHLDTALALATQALTPSDSNDLTMIDEWATPRIGAYAAIEAMLVHAIRGETAEIQTLLTTIETNFNAPDNPYIPAAQTLWQTYQQTQDVLAACQAMAAVVQANPEQAQFFTWMGYNMEFIPIEQVCPLQP